VNLYGGLRACLRRHIDQVIFSRRFGKRCAFSCLRYGDSRSGNQPCVAVAANDVFFVNRRRFQIADGSTAVFAGHNHSIDFTRSFAVASSYERTIATMPLGLCGDDLPQTLGYHGGACQAMSAGVGICLVQQGLLHRDVHPLGTGPDARPAFASGAGQCDAGAGCQGTGVLESDCFRLGSKPVEFGLAHFFGIDSLHSLIAANYTHLIPGSSRAPASWEPSLCFPFFGRETNGRFGWCFGWSHQLADGIKDRENLSIVRLQLPFQFAEAIT